MYLLCFIENEYTVLSKSIDNQTIKTLCNHCKIQAVGWPWRWYSLLLFVINFEMVKAIITRFSLLVGQWGGVGSDGQNHSWSDSHQLMKKFLPEHFPYSPTGNNPPYPLKLFGKPCIMFNISYNTVWKHVKIE